MYSRILCVLRASRPAFFHYPVLYRQVSKLHYLLAAVRSRYFSGVIRPFYSGLSFYVCAGCSVYGIAVTRMKVHCPSILETYIVIQTK